MESKEEIKTKFNSLGVNDKITFTTSGKRVIITKGEYMSSARIGENVYLFEEIDQLFEEGELDF